MKDYLNSIVSKEKVNVDVDVPFRIQFFRIYDRKVANGELTFTEIGMTKDDFISLCTDTAFEMERDAIINLCIRLKLDMEESKKLLCSAGYECLE
ncbi:MAG: hypothetical protein RR495_06770 [Anaerovoracaceae bacterium]